ncbi:amino acid transporter [Moniliophthora roreri]|nr:amino acid transporter [Moniliophthora roreri]
MTSLTGTRTETSNSHIKLQPGGIQQERTVDSVGCLKWAITVLRDSFRLPPSGPHALRGQKPIVLRGALRPFRYSHSYSHDSIKSKTLRFVDGFAFCHLYIRNSFQFGQLVTTPWSSLSRQVSRPRALLEHDIHGADLVIRRIW